MSIADQPSTPASDPVSTGPIPFDYSDRPIAPSESKWKKALWVVATIIAILIGRYILVDLARDPQSTVNNLIAGESLREYVAAEYRFRATFPGIPSKESDNLDVHGYSVPLVSYTKQSTDGTQLYMAAVYDYEAVPVSDDFPDLEGGINGMAQAMENTEIRSISPSTMAGREALEGYMTTTLDGKPYHVYTRLTSRDKQMFALLTMGVEYSQFEQFAQSFQLY